MYGMSGRYGLSISIFVNTVYICVRYIYIYLFIYLFIYVFIYLFICVREAGPKTQERASPATIQIHVCVKFY